MKVGAVITCTLIFWHYLSLNRWFLFYRRKGEVGGGPEEESTASRITEDRTCLSFST